MSLHIIHWLEKNQQPCPVKEITGFQCPGCGMQSAFIALIKGNIVESIMLYPPLTPIMVMIAVLVLHLVFNLKNGALILKNLFIFSVVLIVFNYIYNLIFQ